MLRRDTEQFCTLALYGSRRASVQTAPCARPGALAAAGLVRKKAEFRLSRGDAVASRLSHAPNQLEPRHEPPPGEEPENLVLEFRPRPTQDMLIACLWSKWTGTGEADLLSFAAITDEPPDEVAAAGHDRCIVPIRPGYIDEWLNPLGRHAQELLDILEDRERPYYEHRMAA